jgi:hypothetical protein
MSFAGVNTPFVAGSSTTVQNINTTIQNTYVASGSDVQVSFFFDYPFTGSGVQEVFIPKSWNFTGYAVGCITSGSGAAGFSGSFYQRTTGNALSSVTGFELSAGQYYGLSGLVSIPMTGNNRLGITVNSILSGCRGITLAAYGF